MMSARWTSIALIASAALNLFLIAAAATLIALGADRMFNRPPERAVLRAAAATLSPGRRKQLDTLLRAAGQSIQDANRQARALRRSAWGSLGSATFDPGLAKADLARARALNQASRGKIEDDVLDFTAGLPVGERAAFGDAMGRALARQSRAASAVKTAAPP